MSKSQSEFEQIVADVISENSQYFDGYIVKGFHLVLHVWYNRRNRTYDMFYDFEADGSACYASHNPYGAYMPNYVANEICRRLRE